LNQSHKDDRDAEANHHPRCCQPSRLLQHHGTDLTTSRTQHETNADFVCPLRDRLGHDDAVDALRQALAYAFRALGWTGNQELGYAKSIMDYLFRWLELRFLSEKQLALFVATSADGESTVSASSKASSSVSQFRQDSYEAGDAPLCTTRGSLMVPNGSGYKCSNCGGTSGCS